MAGFRTSQIGVAANHPFPTKRQAMVPRRLNQDNFADCFHPGMEVYAPGCAGHSSVFESWLRQAPDCADGVRFTGVHIPTVNHFDFAALHANARQRVIFLSAELRDSWLAGRVDYLPMTYSGTWQWLAETARFDVALLQVSPPDADGVCSLGVACDFSPAAWPRSMKVLAHVNPAMPHTRGPSIPWNRIDAVVEQGAALLEAPDPPADPLMEAVATRVAGLVPDRASLQLGLGKLQSALLRALCTRRGLRIHSGMVSDGLLELIAHGALAQDPDAVVAGVAIGTRALYDAVSAQVHFREVGYTHDHAVLRAIPRLMAVNSALSVDLLGQVNGECLGDRQVSGVGGLTDFLRGARLSAGGRGIIALPSCTASGTSRIVPLLPAGPVSVARVDADCITTEHGVAELRHLGVHERARAVIAIADPRHRESLEREWHALSRRF
ncbi:MAG: acetyl-CoA hydrolase [Proteobacteria bacterium]|nr:acetyl-CoA hydrolase [Pseudomonadota bacterium]